MDGIESGNVVGRTGGGSVDRAGRVVRNVALAAALAVVSFMVGMGVGARTEKAPALAAPVAPTNQPPTLESLVGKVADLDGKVEMLGQIVVKQKAELDSMGKWASDSFARYHNELALVSRTLADDYGKSKWQRMVDKSVKALTEEAGKARADAEKAKAAGK